MKKIFSLLAAVLFAGSMMAEKAEVTFDFTNPSGLGITAPAASAGTVLADSTITVDEVSMTFTDGSTATRVWNSKGVYDLRVYKNGGTLTLTAQEDITYVKFEGNNVKFDEVAEGSTVWNGTAAKTLTFTANATCNINKVIVGFGKLPTELKAVKDSTTWDFSKITANTTNALYDNNGIHLTDESTPSKNDEVIYADYTEDFMTFAEDFDKAAIAFKGEYPIRKDQYCQAGTLHFKAAVAGTIVVKFSDTGTSASATAVKRYLVVNGEQTEYWTSRENNSDAPYDAQLNVVSDKIEVPAGDVTITGSSAITMYYVTFEPVKEEPVVAEKKTVGEFLALKDSVNAYELTGIVTSIANSTFGNLYLAQGTDTLYIYGLLTPSGEEKKFSTLNVAVNDTLTVLAKYNEHNGKAQAKNAIFVSVKKVPVVPVELEAITVAEFKKLANGAEGLLGEVVVSYVSADGKYNYVQDASGSTLVYFAAGNFGLKAGDKVTGLKGKVSIYNGLFEIVPSVALADLTVVAGEAPAYAEATAAPVADDMNKILVYKGVTAEGEFVAEGKPTTITGKFGTDDFVMYNRFLIAQKFEAGKSYNVTAAVAVYNTTVQVYVISVEEAQAIENIVLTEKVEKVLVDGVIYIVRDGKMFNLQGAQVR